MDRYTALIILGVLFMWLSFLGIVYLKLDAVTKHPCSFCAEAMGEKVDCTAYGMGINFITGEQYRDTSRSITRSFHPDGNITDSGGLDFLEK